MDFEGCSPVASFSVVLPQYWTNLIKPGSWIIPSTVHCDSHSQAAVCTPVSEKNPSYIQGTSDSSGSPTLSGLSVGISCSWSISSPSLSPTPFPKWLFQRNITFLKTHPDPTFPLSADDCAFFIEKIGVRWSVYSVSWLLPLSPSSPRHSILLYLCLSFPVWEDEMLFLL